MLRNIDPLLSPDLLHVLRAMGHGDELAIVDGNFPAEAMGKRLVRLPGADAIAALDAILSLMPLDEFVPQAAFRMEVVGDPAAEQPIFAEFRRTIARWESEKFTLGSIERFAFYERVKGAFAVIATAEARLYGNIILKKEIIRPK